MKKAGEDEEEKQERKNELRKGRGERGRVVQPVEGAGFYLYRVTADRSR